MKNLVFVALISKKFPVALLSNTHFFECIEAVKKCLIIANESCLTESNFLEAPPPDFQFFHLVRSWSSRFSRI